MMGSLIKLWSKVKLKIYYPMLPSPENVKRASSGCFGGTQWLHYPSRSLWTSKACVYVISSKVDGT